MDFLAWHFKTYTCMKYYDINTRIGERNSNAQIQANKGELVTHGQPTCLLVTRNKRK